MFPSRGALRRRPERCVFPKFSSHSYEVGLADYEGASSGRGVYPFGWELIWVIRSGEPEL